MLKRDGSFEDAAGGPVKVTYTHSHLQSANVNKMSDKNIKKKHPTPNASKTLAN